MEMDELDGKEKENLCGWSPWRGTRHLKDEKLQDECRCRYLRFQECSQDKTRIREGTSLSITHWSCRLTQRKSVASSRSSSPAWHHVPFKSAPQIALWEPEKHTVAPLRPVALRRSSQITESLEKTMCVKTACKKPPSESHSDSLLCLPLSLRLTEFCYASLACVRTLLCFSVATYLQNQ